MSLSDFLDKKLHKNHVRSKIIKGKSRPFCSPLGPREEGGSGIHQIEVQKEEGGRNSVLYQLLFEQFKPTSAEKAQSIGERGEFIGSCGERGTLSNLFGIGSSGNSDKGTSSTLFCIGSTYDGEQGTSSTPFGIGSSQADGIGTSVINDMQETGKRSLNPIEGGDGKVVRKASALLVKLLFQEFYKFSTSQQGFIRATTSMKHRYRKDLLH